jgi:hypothetical protein
MANDVPGPGNSPPLIDFNKPAPKPGDIYEPILDPAARLPYTLHRFPLPKITGAGKTFVWPVGIEGFVRAGNATLGVHRYLGANYVDVHQVHLDEARIDMSGTFPGLTSTKNMRDLIAILVARGSKQLYLPGVFTAIQTVFCQNYSFDHAEDDRTHSVVYTMSFVRTTTTGKIDTKQMATEQVGARVPPGPPQGAVGSKPMNMAVTTDGMATFRAISDYVYDDPDKWQSLVNLNKKEFSTYNQDRGVPEPIPPYQLVLSRLNLGTRIAY